MWTLSPTVPGDDGSRKYYENYVALMNQGRITALVKKHAESYLVEDAGDFDEGTVFQGALPNRNGIGHTANGPTRRAPKVRATPNATEIRAALEGKLVGQLANAQFSGVVRGYHDSTGSFPVVRQDEPTELMYYVPALLVPGETFNPAIHNPEPRFITFNVAEMPSFVFWTRKLEAPAKDSRVVRSGAPSPEVKPSTLVVDTEKSQGKQTQKEAEYEWEIFNPKDEEGPVDFLDYYITKFHGYHGIRSKMMLREEDIERVNWISPCLQHGHKTAESITKDLPPKTVGGSSADTAGITAAPAIRKKPDPIPEDDPSWVAFKKRLEHRQAMRNYPMHPEPVFTPKYCNTRGAPKDPNKAILTRALYDDYHRRAVLSENELESRSKCCLACGLDWMKTSQTHQEHYDQHREEYKKYQEVVEQKYHHIEPVLRAAHLTAPGTGVPELNWFRDLEQIVQKYENELLEREEVCRICDLALDYSTVDPARHYAEHREERDLLRTVYHTMESSKPEQGNTTLMRYQPGTGIEILNTFSEEPFSPPARPHTGWSEKSPPFMKRHEAAVKAARERERIGQALKDLGEQILVTGRIPTPSPPSSSNPLDRGVDSQVAEPIRVSRGRSQTHVAETTVPEPETSRSSQRLRSQSLNRPSQSRVSPRASKESPTQNKVSDFLKEGPLYSAVPGSDLPRESVAPWAKEITGGFAKDFSDSEAAEDPLGFLEAYRDRKVDKAQKPDAGDDGLGFLDAYDGNRAKDLLNPDAMDIDGHSDVEGEVPSELEGDSAYPDHEEAPVPEPIVIESSESSSSDSSDETEVEPHRIMEIDPLSKNFLRRPITEVDTDMSEVEAPLTREAVREARRMGASGIGIATHGKQTPEIFSPENTIDFGIRGMYNWTSPTTAQPAAPRVAEEASSDESDFGIKAMYDSAAESSSQAPEPKAKKSLKARADHLASMIKKSQLQRRLEHPELPYDPEADKREVAIFVERYILGQKAKQSQNKVKKPKHSKRKTKPSSVTSTPKRNRPTALPTPEKTPSRKRKRKATDDGKYEPQESPRRDDEPSPKLRKKARRTADPLYRPGPVDETTPPPTPMKKPATKAERRKAKKAARIAEKWSAKNGARALTNAEEEENKKVEKQGGKGKKRVTFDKSVTSGKGAGKVEKKKMKAKKEKKEKAAKKEKKEKKKVEAVVEITATGRPKRKAAEASKGQYLKEKIIG